MTARFWHIMAYFQGLQHHVCMYGPLLYTMHVSHIPCERSGFDLAVRIRTRWCTVDGSLTHTHAYTHMHKHVHIYITIIVYIGGIRLFDNMGRLEHGMCTFSRLSSVNQYSTYHVIEAKGILHVLLSRNAVYGTHTRPLSKPLDMLKASDIQEMGATKILLRIHFTSFEARIISMS